MVILLKISGKRILYDQPFSRSDMGVFPLKLRGKRHLLDQLLLRYEMGVFWEVFGVILGSRSSLFPDHRSDS